MKVSSSFLVFLLCFVNSYAQQFKYEAKVDTVDSSGFYKIWIAPEINSNLKDGFVDLRLFDNDQKETPYLLSMEQASYTNLSYINYNIIERKFIPDSLSLITILNKEKSRIDNIRLLIKNAEVHKKINLSGSDDLKNWYVVKDYDELNSINSSAEVSEIKLINFPLTNYLYYRITFDDKNSLPVNIISAGYYENETQSGAYTELMPHSVLYSDSSKAHETWIQVYFHFDFNIDLVTAKVESPKFFLRNVDAYILSMDKTGKEVMRFLKTVELKSSSEFKISFNDLRAQKLLFCIHNEDNPPIKFSELKFYQLNRYAMAFLEKSKSYKLRFGNDTITSPNYDLKYFQNIIPKNLPVLNVDEITNMRQQINSQPEKPYTFFTNKKFIWGAIGLIIIFLGVITFRMLKEK